MPISPDLPSETIVAERVSVWPRAQQNAFRWLRNDHNLGLARATHMDAMPIILTLLAMGSNLASTPMEPRTKCVIAHRGASAYLPEHTLPAKAMAHAMGADYLEQDVVLSRDDVPVILHDIHLDAVTDVARRFPDRARPDGRFYALDFTLAELKTLRVDERIDVKKGRPAFPGRFPRGQASFEIPTLDEELQFIKGLNQSTGREAGIYPEIKRPAWHRKQGHDISRIVLSLLDRHGYRTREDKIYLQCFDWAEIRRLRNELGCQYKLVQLLGRGEECADHPRLMTPDGLREVARVAQAIGPSISHVLSGDSPVELRITALIANAHAAGLDVHPYTARHDELPPHARSFEELLESLLMNAGADGIFTDCPDRVVAFLRNKNQPPSR